MLRARRTRGSGGTGRRARLRGVWFTPYGFKSRFPHQKKQVGFSLPAFLCGNGQAKPVSALAVRARLLAKAQSSIARYVQLSRFHGISLPAFFFFASLFAFFHLSIDKCLHSYYNVSVKVKVSLKSYRSYVNEDKNRFQKSHT